MAREDSGVDLGANYVLIQCNLSNYEIDAMIEGRSYTEIVKAASFILNIDQNPNMNNKTN